MHFDQQGYVSVWVGHFASSDTFQNHIEFVYDEDGNVDSFFGREAQIEGFDHDVHEAMYYPDGIGDLYETLAPYSYADSFIEPLAAEIQAQGLFPFNAIYILYDYAYPADLVDDQQQLRFVGAFPYYE